MPSLVVATGKTVIHSSSHKRVRFAHPRWRLPLTVTAMRPGGDVMVKISGGMEVYGLVALKDLGVLVCKPAPMGERYYAGDHNMLGVRSVVKDGRLMVGGEIQIRVKDYGKDVPYAQQFSRVPLEGAIGVENLCRVIPPKKHAGTNKDPYIVRSPGETHLDDFPSGTPEVSIKKEETLTLHASPGGQVIHTRGPSRWGYSLVRVGRRDGWDQVAVGGGPYLLGWIPSRPDREPVTGGIGGLLGTMGKMKGPASLHTRALKAKPLHRLPAGTPVQQFGVVHARLIKAGYARVITHQDGWVYVNAAVDDDVMVEGWVRPANLGAKVESHQPSNPINDKD